MALPSISRNTPIKPVTVFDTNGDPTLGSGNPPSVAKNTISRNAPIKFVRLFDSSGSPILG